MKRYTVIDTDCEADVWFDNVENKPLDYKDIEKILEKQSSQWQKLKGWLKEEQAEIQLAGQYFDTKETRLLSDYIDDILERMQELEGEDE